MMEGDEEGGDDDDEGGDDEFPVELIQFMTEMFNIVPSACMMELESDDSVLGQQIFGTMMMALHSGCGVDVMAMMAPPCEEEAAAPCGEQEDIHRVKAKATKKKAGDMLVKKGEMLVCADRCDAGCTPLTHLAYEEEWSAACKAVLPDKYLGILWGPGVTTQMFCPVACKLCCNPDGPAVGCSWESK